MKKWKSNSLISTVIMLVIGIWLFVHPGETLETGVRLFGVALLLVGAVGLISQFVRREDRSAGSAVIAVVEVIAGLVVLASPTFVVSLFPMIAGALIALSGISDLIAAMKRKNKGAALVFALITVLLGAVIFFHPFKSMTTLVRILGIVLIYKGITGLFIRGK